MKKIFAVSIMAVMAVTAANAEIASKAYVDQQTGPLGNGQSVATTYQTLANKATDLSGTFADDTQYPSAKAVKTAIATAQNAATASPATTELAGIIEIATDAEVSTGTDTSRAVTPKQLHDGLATKQDVIDSTHKLAASNVDGLANVATTGAYSDLTGTPTVDNTYDATSANAQSGVAVASAISAAGANYASAAQGAKADTALQPESSLDGSKLTAGSVPETALDSTTQGKIDGALSATTAASTYLSQSDAASTYLSKNDATSTYQTNANLSSSISTDTGSTTKYPSVKAVEDAIGEAAYDDTTLAASVQANTTAIGDANSGLIKGVADNASAIGTINTTLGTYGDVVTHNAADFQAAGNYVQANDAITASGTTNKIVQYDAKGLVIAGTTAGALATKSTIANADVASDAAIDMSKIAMPTTIADGTNVTYGTYSLTADVGQNGITYKWELIQRAQ